MNICKGCHREVEQVEDGRCFDCLCQFQRSFRDPFNQQRVDAQNYDKRTLTKAVRDPVTGADLRTSNMSRLDDESLQAIREIVREEVRECFNITIEHLKRDQSINIFDSVEYFKS